MYRSTERSTVGAIIPARGGSKGIPRKNLAPIGNLPLIAWTINAAKASGAIDRVVVSTEDAEIADTALAYGAEVPFVRSLDLASDTATGVDVILHALENLPDIDVVVLLQATSPLRTTDHIDEAIDLFFARNAPSCVSVTAVKEHPDLIFKMKPKSQQLIPLADADRNLRRQDRSHLFRVNGAIYVAERNWIFENRSFLTEETIGYIMNPLHSLDIDTPEDLLIARHLISSEYGRETS